MATPSLPQGLNTPCCWVCLAGGLARWPGAFPTLELAPGWIQSTLWLGCFNSLGLGEMVRWALGCSPLFVGSRRQVEVEMAEPGANPPKCQTQIRTLY